ncbi:Two component system response regulator/histidine kinase [Candidatus Magnetomoraceae bacterium gMMP-1]
MASERVLLLGLGLEESNHIKSLLSSFDINILSEDVDFSEKNEALFNEFNICLIIFHIYKHSKKINQQIRKIKSLAAYPIPLIILISKELIPNVRQYLNAGADDYWVLPLDETVFTTRFYVLLEWGQTMLRFKPEKDISNLRKKTVSKAKPSSFWERIRSRFQEGLNFFSPKTLIKPEHNLPIVYKWEKLRKLGFGSFGEVWLVREQGEENMAVAKIPHSEKTNIAFLRAAAILKRISDHPNAVHLIEVVKDQGKIVLIQEYVPGRTLQEYIELGMDKTEKENAFLQLVEVVSYAHEYKIMHRDIKPENIIIKPDGRLKLLDFGSAKELRYNSISKTIVGSRPFMSPEQVMGKSCISSDVWALGVVLYSLFTGFLPFYDDNEKQLMDLILEIDPTPPSHLKSDISKKLEFIILKCLEKNIKKRYPNASALKTDLLKYFPDFGKKISYSKK